MSTPTITASISGARSEPAVRAAIARAATAVGVDFGYLYNQARLESSLDPQAKAATSSAAGLFQFTRQTWLQTIKTHGADHGLAWAAAAIERGRNGLIVADPSTRSAIDQLRYDPELSSVMAAEFAADNRATIEARLGRSAAPVDLYLAHFLGAAGAGAFLEAHDADPEAAAAPMFPTAAAANRAVFYGPGGVPRSLAQIRANFAAKLETMAAPTVAPTRGQAPTFTQARRDSAQSSSRSPLEMTEIEPMPARLSLAFAARAYQRLAGIGA